MGGGVGGKSRRPRYRTILSYARGLLYSHGIRLCIHCFHNIPIYTSYQTCLPTYLHTYTIVSLPIYMYLPAYQSTYLTAYLSTYSSTEKSIPIATDAPTSHADEHSNRRQYVVAKGVTRECSYRKHLNRSRWYNCGWQRLSSDFARCSNLYPITTGLDRAGWNRFRMRKAAFRSPARSPKQLQPVFARDNTSSERVDHPYRGNRCAAQKQSSEKSGLRCRMGMEVIKWSSAGRTRLPRWDLEVPRGEVSSFRMKRSCPIV